MSVRVRVAIDFIGDGSFEFIADSHICSCSIVNYKEATGGFVTNGVLVLDNCTNCYNAILDTRLVPFLQVQVYYVIEDSENPIKRFTLYVDDRGFQLNAIGNEDRFCVINLVDYSYFLKRTETKKDWKQTQHAKHCFICDKSQPKKSLVHILCKNAHIHELDIDCSYLPMTLDYVEFTGSVWDELSLLANAYNAHLECGYGALVSFTQSAYDDTYIEDTTTEKLLLTENDITEFRQYEDLEHYKNVLRLKWTQYAFIETRVKLWEYKDFPILYDGTTELYPFGENTRDIEKYENYCANYSYKDDEGREYTVVAAEDVYTKEEFENALVTVGNAITVQNYNTTLYENKALVQLTSTEKTNLKHCEIWGKPIIANTNFSHYIENETSVLTYGKNVLNVTNKYLSASMYDDMPFYEQWAIDALQELSTLRQKVSVKTHKPVVLLRAGHSIRLDLNTVCGGVQDIKIDSITFTYNKKEGFEIGINY